MTTVKIGIVNVTGYAGMELARLLSSHSGVEIACVTGRSAAGQKLNAFLPHLKGLKLVIDSEADPEKADLFFLALPHRESALEAARLFGRGKKVIDLSADFRLKDPALYPEWYGFEHPCKELLSRFVYGLPELYRKQIENASLVASPGCYPTAAILALAPALREGLIDSRIIIDAKSGLSGAGRSLSLKSHYAEADENVTAYATEGHRHLPEIIQELDGLTDVNSSEITFIPHLVPATRGILATCYGNLRTDASAADLQELYSSFYQDEPFVQVVSSPPHTKQVTGSNNCLVFPGIDNRTRRLVAVSVIDNLVKGAAGQAVQSMNLMLGFEEDSGLGGLALYP